MGGIRDPRQMTSCWIATVGLVPAWPSAAALRLVRRLSSAVRKCAFLRQRALRGPSNASPANGHYLPHRTRDRNCRGCYVSVVEALRKADHPGRLLVQTNDAEAEITSPLPLSTYNGPGVLRQDPRRPAESAAEASLRNGSYEVCISFWSQGWRLAVLPMCGLLVTLRVFGPAVRASALLGLTT